MLVAVMDQSLATSTFFCSKIDLPVASVMDAVRSSHSTWSKAGWLGFVNRRLKVRPGADFFSVVLGAVVGADVAAAVLVLSVTSAMCWLLHLYRYCCTRGPQQLYFSNWGGKA